MTKRVLVTGGAGFVASHLIEHIFKNTDWYVVNLDRLDKHSSLKRVGEVIDLHPQYKSRYQFTWWDLKAPITPQLAHEMGKVNAIFHLAASSHVDDSIRDPLLYAYDNVIGTVNILNYAKSLDSLDYYTQFGTDERHGNAPKGVAYKEADRDLPRNPYAAFKTGADHVAYSYFTTYGLPVVISNCTNILGEKQDGRKYLPLVINKVLKGEELQIHCYPGCKEAGTRQYVHARNVAAACLFLHDYGVKGERYNMPGQVELSNLELAVFISKVMNKPLIYKMVDFHSDRPGHDLRYSLDGTKLMSMGFQYPVDFYPSLEKTIKWYLNNQHWLI